MTDRYVQLNRAMWDERAPAHAASPDYDVERSSPTGTTCPTWSGSTGRASVTGGLRGAHLQCHIGTDTLSLPRPWGDHVGLGLLRGLRRAGAPPGRAAPGRRSTTTSPTSTTRSRCSAPAYDFVYTGIGVLCWLPDVARWARVITGLLKPGGRFFIREGHPVLWATDLDRLDGSLVVDFPYFERTEPTIWDEPGTT